MRIGQRFKTVYSVAFSLWFLVACSTFDAHLGRRKSEQVLQIDSGITDRISANDGEESYDPFGLSGAGGLSLTSSDPIDTGEWGDSGTDSATGAAGQSSYTGPVCGDGKVTGHEKCDIAIAAYDIGACPIECKSTNKCLVATVIGEACVVECVLSEPACRDGDGCCPANCDRATDSDCSVSCGDGIVQTDAGETCELSPTDEGGSMGDKVCLAKCPDDDGDPCTAERMTGSVGNCNVVCETVPIIAPADDDGCCPTGANAATDNDCTPDCGNGIQEGDEECDGTYGCGDQCTLTLTPEQRACSHTYNYATAGEECDACMCEFCGTQMTSCYGSANSDLNAKCADIIACGFENICLGSDCYCGTAVRSGVGLCPFGDANGACKQTIEEAAETTAISDIFTMQLDLTTAPGRARALGDCYAVFCQDICWGW
jgi:hypothetical protein